MKAELLALAERVERRRLRMLRLKHRLAKISRMAAEDAAALRARAEAGE